MRRRKTERKDGSYHGPCTVALFDVLGFKELARTKSLDDLARLVNHDFASMIPLAALAGQSESWVTRFRPAPCIAITFADTVLLCSPNDGERGFVSVLTASMMLMSGCFLKGILLRGAITSGDMHVSADHARYFGEAMVRAYELEKEQEWAGAVLDEARLPRAPDAYMTTEVRRELLTVRYPIPHNDGRRIDSLCLNWPPAFSRLFEGNLSDHLAQHAPASDSRALRKQANTVEFYEWARARWSERLRDSPRIGMGDSYKVTRG